MILEGLIFALQHNGQINKTQTILAGNIYRTIIGEIILEF
jgi:hypothetical protein